MTQKIIDWRSQPLGQIPDTKLAEKLGVSTSTIRVRREELSIKVYSKVHNWDKQPLGEVPDIELALKLKVAVTTVIFQRKKRNIPTFNPISFVEPRDSDPYVSKCIGGSPLNW